MASTTREKLALLVFGLLILLGLAGVGWYLVVGHSWNVAASKIDDSVGQMEGYTAIVYSGTTAPKATASSIVKNQASSSQQGSSQSAESQSVSAPASSHGGSAYESSEVNKDAATGSTSDVGSVAASVIASQAQGSAASQSSSSRSDGEDSKDPSSEGSESAVTDAVEESSVESSAVSSSVEADEATSEPFSSKGSSSTVDPDDVSASYKDKKSSVLTLDTVTGEAYREGSIVKRGTKRIGIISIDAPVTALSANTILQPFVDSKVDMVICVTPYKRYVEAVTGLDIVVTTQDESVSTMGENFNKTFYVAAPEQGKVGAVLVSPSNTVSAKIIDSL